MTTQEKLIQVREWIVKACNDKICNCYDQRTCEHEPCMPVLGIAEVLRTLEKQSTLPDDYVLLCNGRLGQDGSKYWRKWNLAKDTLEQQDAIVIDFLFQLIK